MNRLKKIAVTLLILVLSLNLFTACNNSKKTTMRDITSMELVADMGLGWNLGNTLDALPDETSWGNPKATDELIKAVKDAGFKTVRIPITWIDHTGGAPDYEIDEDWMDRVEEVVGYVLDNDMYAIINIHHDGGNGISGMWLTPKESDFDEGIARFTKVWEQISERFKDYSDYLIFESMNEIHDNYKNPTEENNDIIANFNQKFVDIVRQSGGNNAKRHLLVPGYNTNIEQTIAGFVMPDDEIQDRISVSVHFYDPWTFTAQGENYTLEWGKSGQSVDTWGQEDWIDNIFSKLKVTYIDKGIPVIIGEYGAVVRAEEGHEQFRRYYMEYVTKTAYDNGIMMVYWDNGYNGTKGEAFGLFNRSNNEQYHSEIIKAMVRASSGNEYEIELP